MHAMPDKLSQKPRPLHTRERRQPGGGYVSTTEFALRSPMDQQPLRQDAADVALPGKDVPSRLKGFRSDEVQDDRGEEPDVVRMNLDPRDQLRPRGIATMPNVDSWGGRS